MILCWDIHYLSLPEFSCLSAHCQTKQMVMLWKQHATSRFVRSWSAWMEYLSVSETHHRTRPYHHGTGWNHWWQEYYDVCHLPGQHAALSASCCLCVHVVWCTAHAHPSILSSVVWESLAPSAAFTYTPTINLWRTDQTIIWQHSIFYHLSFISKGPLWECFSRQIIILTNELTTTDRRILCV